MSTWSIFKYTCYLFLVVSNLCSLVPLIPLLSSVSDFALKQDIDNVGLTMLVMASQVIERQSRPSPSFLSKFRMKGLSPLSLSLFLSGSHPAESKEGSTFPITSDVGKVLVQSLEPGGSYLSPQLSQ